MLTIFSVQDLGKEITSFLGEQIPQADLENCLATLEIVEPSLAKQFWRLQNASPGVYIVLEGKVRLLDSTDNLITTLTIGTTFGEGTLFTKEDWQVYAARASHGLKLCYLQGEVLQALIYKYPTIGDRLFVRAELWDLLLRYCATAPQHPATLPAILQALSLFERHHLEIGSLPPEFYQDSQLWILYRGELTNFDGRKLTATQMHVPKQEGWQVTQASVVYLLKKADYSSALQHWPDLVVFTNSQVISVTTGRKIQPKPFLAAPVSREHKVIPFRTQSAGKQKPQPKKQRHLFPSPKVKARHWWGHLTKQYPFYAQQSASDCGAACLVMIGRYWGKNFSLSKLREQVNVNRDGASLRELGTVAETLGFTSRPVKASLDKFAEQCLPAIAHWQGKHFIVVYEISPKTVTICDPAIGQRTLSHAQFLAGWTGYTLLLQPTVDLKDAQEANNTPWQFFELVKPHWKVLLEVFIASVVLQIFGLVSPIFTQILLDRVLVQGSIVTLNAVIVGMLIFGLFSLFINGIRQYLLAHTANRISVSMLVGFIKHTFRLPLSYFESRYVGDIVSRIQENHKIQNFLTGESLSILLDLMTVCVYLVVMFWYSWRMALMALLTIPPFFILVFASTNILRRMSREIFSASAQENSYLIQALTGIRSVRSMAIEQSVRWRWEELLNKVVKKSFRAQIINNRLQIISGAINLFTSTGLLWFGAWQVINQELTIGQLIAFNMLLGNVISPFQRLAVVWNQLQEIMISVERINDVLGAEPEEDLQTQERQPIKYLRGHIRFENVTFRYHPESDINILENINLEIQPEQTVAIVGRSGSGKTTLTKLILGLYPPSDGKILIDGQDITTIALKSLRSQVGVVDQDTFLFGGTIKENLTIAHPEATQQEIIQAGKLAGADEFIQKLPMGYETQIGEGGGLLSGGQRQRIAIARALLGNPRLILLDEATSHLDSESERIIQNNFRTILQGRTSIIIAHRLSTIRNADLILVLDRGVLLESGTHDELIAKKGHYYYLNQQQFRQTG
ncbi:MAG: peptidase domain-containing ABC transporter [Nostoc sp.]|uniref:peptidase domain-containing ABC transporter n=1 Tax=Nostoc sp. TaxID=1180 RepID=UPI002FFB8A91